MKNKDLKYIIWGIGLIFIISIIYPFLKVNSDEEYEAFLSLAVLNSQEKVGEYFENKSAVRIGQIHNWNLLIENKGRESEKIFIRVKLANSLSSVPDQIECTPSDSPTLYEAKDMVTPNQDTMMPLEWEISNYTTSSLNMTINNSKVYSELDLDLSKEMVIIIELWVYDKNTGDYVFGWRSRNVEQCIWNKLIFRLN